MASTGSSQLSAASSRLIWLACMSSIRHYRREMGIETLYPRPKRATLSEPGGQAGSEPRVYPYLLRNLAVERPDQVWGVGCPLGEHLHPSGERLDVSGSVPGLV